MTHLEDRLRRSAKHWVEVPETERLLAKISKDLEKDLERVAKKAVEDAIDAVVGGQADLLDSVSADLTAHDGNLYIGVWCGYDDLASDCKLINLADAFDDLANEIWGMEAEPESLAVMDAFLERAKAARDKLAARVAAPRPKLLDIFSDEGEAP